MTDAVTPMGVRLCPRTSSPNPDAAPGPAAVAVPSGRRAAVRAAARRRPAVAAAAAALAALTVHLFLPNGQTPEATWADALPRLAAPLSRRCSKALAAVALLLAAAQWVWRSLRPWARHYAPLLGRRRPRCLRLGFDYAQAQLDDACPISPARTRCWRRSSRTATFCESTWHSLLLLVTGYAAGVTAGLVTGVLIGWFAARPLLGNAGPQGARPAAGHGPDPAGDDVVVAVLRFRGRADRLRRLVPGDDADRRPASPTSAFPTLTWPARSGPGGST